MMKQLQAGWEARGARAHVGNLSVGRSLLSQLQASTNGERVIVTWTGTPGEVREIVEANDRMSFLLALSTELVRIRTYLVPFDQLNRLDVAQGRLPAVDIQPTDGACLLH